MADLNDLGLNVPSLLPLQAPPQNQEQVLNYLQSLHNYLAGDRLKIARAIDTIAYFRHIISPAASSAVQAPANSKVTRITDETGLLEYDSAAPTGTAAWNAITSGDTLHADAGVVEVVTTAFDGILSALDDDVQAALDTIDDHLHDGRYYTETEVDNLIAEATQQVEYVPDSYTLNTGTIALGQTVANVQTMNDGSVLVLDEVTGVPGFDLDFNFVSVDTFEQIWLHYDYDGSASHTVQLRLYNYTTVGWDVISSFVGSDGNLHFLSVPVPSWQDYVDGSGNAKASLYHITTGNAAHEIDIDYIALVKVGFGGVADHGSLTGLEDQDHPAIAVYTDTTNFAGHLSATDTDVQAALDTLDDHTHVEADITNLDHTDANAIHDNVASEISAITEKTTPVSADLLIIEDSAASNAKKKLQIGNLPASSALAPKTLAVVNTLSTATTTSYKTVADVSSGPYIIHLFGNVDTVDQGYFKLTIDGTVIFTDLLLNAGEFAVGVNAVYHAGPLVARSSFKAEAHDNGPTVSYRLSYQQIGLT